MAIYAVGDLQGCYEPLMRLLDKLKFDPGRDTLWLTGDLINRGPHSLASLRFVKSLGKHAVTVLGNHDLHLLALANQPETERAEHPLNSILTAHDAGELLKWLAHRPLMHVDKSLNIAMVHAGILPRWSISKAKKRAGEVERVLRSQKRGRLLAGLYGNQPSLWRGDLSGIPRLRFIVNAFTRMRMLTRNGGLNMKIKGHPSSAPAGSVAWFETPHQRGNTTVVFGHWSAMGLINRPGLIGLDTGCVWGRSLTAIRLDDEHRQPISLSCNSIHRV